MNRWEVIQKVIDLFGAENYLEIGYQTGVNFNQITCKNKIAVDPAPRNTPPNGTLVIETSDDFFKKNTTKFDVVFVDGLHTHEQSFRDVKNSLEVLNDPGIILLHDTNPLTEQMSTPSKSHKEFIDKYNTTVWCGDVWKTVPSLLNLGNLGCITLNIETGLTLVFKSDNPPANHDINNIMFRDIPQTINLNPISELGNILNHIKEIHGL